MFIGWVSERVNGWVNEIKNIDSIFHLFYIKSLLPLSFFLLGYTTIPQILVHIWVLTWLPNIKTAKNSSVMRLRKELHICIYKHVWGLMVSDKGTADCFYCRETAFAELDELQVATPHRPCWSPVCLCSLSSCPSSLHPFKSPCFSGFGGSSFSLLILAF